MIILNEAIRVGSSPIWLVSLKQENMKTCTHKKRHPDYMRTHQKRLSASPGKKPQKKPNLPTPWSWISSPQNFERMQSWHFKIPVCGVLAPRRLIQVVFTGITINTPWDSVTCPRSHKSQWQSWKWSPRLDSEPDSSSACNWGASCLHTAAPYRSSWMLWGTQLLTQALLQHLETRPRGDHLAHKMYHCLQIKQSLKSQAM